MLHRSMAIAPSSRSAPPPPISSCAAGNAGAHIKMTPHPQRDSYWQLDSLTSSLKAAILHVPPTGRQFVIGRISGFEVEQARRSILCKFRNEHHMTPSHLLVGSFCLSHV